MNWQEAIEHPSLQDLPFNIDLYLAKGAREVWLCDDSVRLTIHVPTGIVGRSKIPSGFPAQVFARSGT